MRATILDKTEVAEGTLLVRFKLSEDVDFKPGQYFVIRLFNPPYHDEKGAMRHFTIVNSPAEKNILSFATRVRDSAFKKSIQEFPLGTEVEVGPIRGDFVLPDDSNKPLVFIAGGIGITPFFSMLQHVKEENLGYKITLLYSNRDQASAAFLKELQDLSQQNPNFKLVLTMTEDPGWSGEKEKIDAGFIKKHVEDLQTAFFYTAGPPAMVEVIIYALKEAGVDSSRIKSENFSGY